MAIYQLFGSLVLALIWTYKETHSSFFFLIKNFLNREVKMSFSHEKQVDVIKIPSGKIGLVEAKKGENLSGNQFGKVVECMNFQDEIAFINNGGQKGKQLSFLTAGTYRINTEYFSVEIADEIRINEDAIGLVRARSGQPRFRQHFGKVVECNDFQDAQAFINNGGQEGKQLAILTSNIYSINTWIFEITIGSITKIPWDEIGLVFANDGTDIPLPRKLGKIVECKNFEDAQAFIDNGGESGKQLAILREGKKYQINTELFTVITSANAEQYGLKPKQLKYYKVEQDSIGIVRTTEGRTDLLRMFGPRIEGHDNFQSPQKFIDAGGYKGLQEEVLLEAEYSLNPWFVRVEQAPLVEIPPHCIGILSETFPETIDHKSVNNAITIKPPGKHPINTAIQKVYIVPTNTIRVRWWDRSKNTPLDYPPLIIRTNEESYLLNLILEFTIQKDSTYDSTYEFIKAVAGNLNELRVVSHEYLISTFVEGNLEDIVIDIYRCEISKHNHEELKTNEIQDKIKQQAKSKMMERCKPYYISIEENKESMSFFFSRDREEM